MKQFGPYILTLACSFIVTLIFFNVLATDTTVKINNINTRELHLQQQIDSLENVINTTFKNQKDTIIINIHPHDVKVYNYERSTRH